MTFGCSGRRQSFHRGNPWQITEQKTTERDPSRNMFESNVILSFFGYDCKPSVEKNHIKKGKYLIMCGCIDK